MLRLHVNVDHVATLRQARRVSFPDPVEWALRAESAGAQGITCHLRKDRRHIQDADLARLRSRVRTLLNLECSLDEEMVAIALASGADAFCLVPENRAEITTEGGLDVAGQREEVRAFVAGLAEAAIQVSLFIDADAAQFEAAWMPGVVAVELNTAAYADHGTRAELERLAKACALARQAGFEVAAGHGLNLHNLPALVAAAPDIEEYNIGHALIGDAVFLGLEASVQRYKSVCQGR